MKNSPENITLTLQTITKKTKDLPTSKTFKSWVKSILTDKSLFPNNCKAEITIRIVDNQESSALNLKYRKKTGPTNILSFHYDSPDNLVNSKLFYGDLVICWPMVQAEALELNKSTKQHAAHLVIHGILHLLGYDHSNDQEAEIMETLETKLLKKLKIA